MTRPVVPITHATAEGPADFCKNCGCVAHACPLFVSQLYDRGAELRRAIALVESVLTELARSRNPVVCVAQGRLETAFWAIQESANLLGELPAKDIKR